MTFPGVGTYPGGGVYPAGVLVADGSSNRILTEAAGSYILSKYLGDTTVQRKFDGSIDPSTLDIPAIGDAWWSSAAGTPVTPPVSYDWSATNLPWSYATTAVFTARWPSGVTIVDLQTGSADFWTNLSNTVAAAGKRCVVRLQAQTYHLSSFRLIGSSGDPTYSYGFWFPNLQGFLGQGADKSIIQMDANSVTSAQLAKQATMTTASGAPNQMGFCRLDGTSASPILVSGVTFRGADQNLLTSKASDVPAIVPQPAPYQGVTLYPGFTAIFDHVRFQGCSHAATSQPPFEQGNINSQKGSASYYNCESDGRLAPEINAAQPRRSGFYMANNEVSSLLQDCWLHHSNVSRYAANDQNSSTAGTYTLTRTKLEQVSNTHNVDPVYGSMGGGTNASCCGWESSHAVITLTDCILNQDDPFTDGQIAQHLQFTSVGGVNPQGGRLHVSGGTFHNSGFPSVDGFLCIRAIPGTFWVSDGFATTMDVRSASGTAKTAHVVTGTWPPTAASLTTAGVAPSTHYLVRES